MRFCILNGLKANRVKRMSYVMDSLQGSSRSREQKFRAEVLSPFSPSNKRTQGIFVNRKLKFLKSQGSPKSLTKSNIFMKPFQTFQEVDSLADQ